MQHLEGNTTLASEFVKTVKIERKYGAPHSAKLYTVICQISGSIGAKKLTNDDILLSLLNIFQTGNTPNINLAK